MCCNTPFRESNSEKFQLYLSFFAGARDYLLMRCKQSLLICLLNSKALKEKERRERMPARRSAAAPLFTACRLRFQLKRVERRRAGKRGVGVLFDDNDVAGGAVSAVAAKLVVVG